MIYLVWTSNTSKYCCSTNLFLTIFFGAAKSAIMNLHYITQYDLGDIDLLTTTIFAAAPEKCVGLESFCK